MSPLVLGLRMIVVDTNVISEVVKPSPAANVVSWLNEQQSVDLYITTVTIGEISFGIEALPVGKRRTSLANAIGRFIEQAFGHRILVPDQESAWYYGAIMAERRRSGRPMTAPDGQIAAIARRYKYQLATRNIKDFEETGLELVNPFAGS